MHTLQTLGHTRDEPADILPGTDIELPKGEEATETELQLLNDQVRIINARAEIIEANIAKLLFQADDACSTEIESARQQAREMRGAAMIAVTEINTAPTDPKTGKKLIPAKRVASLSGSIATMIHEADRENNAINEAVSESQAHESKTKAHTKTKSKTCAVVTVKATKKRGRLDVGGDNDDEEVEEEKGFFRRNWVKATGAISGVTASIAAFNPIGKMADLGDDLLDGATDLATNGLNAVRAVPAKVSDALEHGVTTGRRVVNKVITTVTAPFQKPALPQLHVPITINPQGILTNAANAMNQAKAAVAGLSLPAIHVPNLANLVPSPSPLIQGVAGHLLPGI